MKAGLKYFDIKYQIYYIYFLSKKIPKNLL